MQINNLKILNDAPEYGCALVYTRREKPNFKEYSSIEQIKQEFANKEILEIHLFNSEKEYRAISSTSHKHAGRGCVECIVTDEEYGIVRDNGNIISKDSNYKVYEETTKISQDCEMEGWLKVCNYVAFDDRGMSQVVDYRLIMGGNN